MTKEELCKVMNDYVENGDFSESTQIILFEASEKYEFYLETLKNEQGADHNLSA
jgi:hypothetical protein